jgi:hypothetical protein
VAAFPLILMATFIRIIASYFILYNIPRFFTGVFPKYNIEYSILKAALPFFTIVSVVGGGVLGDYYDSEKGGRRYRMRGYISAIGTIITIPTLYVCFFLQYSFWASAGSLIIGQLFGQQFFSLSISMVNNMLPSHLQGTGTAIYLFTLNASLTVSQLALSAATKDIDDNSKYGEILGWFSLFSFVGSLPFYIYGGIKYEEKMRDITKKPYQTN